MLKLKLRYFGHLMGRAHSLKKTLILRKAGGDKRSGWWRLRWLDDVTNSMDMSLSRLREILKDMVSRHAAVYRVAKSWT